MKLPQETHSESQRYECDNCHKIFRKKVEIIRHTIKHSQDFEESRIKTVDGALKENQCLICLDIVPNKNFLESHYKEHSIEDLICKICAHKSQTHIEFNQHCRSHPENFTFQCSICSKKILTQFSIVRHLLSHQKVISYACNLCERTFDTRRLLKEHIRKVRHPDNEFLCPLCGDKLASKKVLERHVIRHSGIKTLSCSLCPTKFYFNSEFMTLVTKFKNSKKIILIPDDLKVHIASHSNVRKHICDICGASFNCNSSMRKHGRVHLDESEYKFACDVCGKK